MKKDDCVLSNLLKISGELEGGLFAELSLNYCGRNYVARRDLYTVIDGKVYSVSNRGEKPYATGDTLWNLKRDCHRIGKYNPKKVYQLKTNTLSYSEVKKILKV